MLGWPSHALRGTRPPVAAPRAAGCAPRPAGCAAPRPRPAGVCPSVRMTATEKTVPTAAAASAAVITPLYRIAIGRSPLPLRRLTPRAEIVGLTPVHGRAKFLGVHGEKTVESE